MKRGSVGLWLLACSACAPAAAETVQPGQRWAWSENAGWVDARPLGEGGAGLHASDGVVSGWLYAANLGWISAHCLNTGSCDEVAYGLRLEAITGDPTRLRLNGLMWSENVGWIATHCSATQSCAQHAYGLEVDVLSGQIDGHAWSPNVGWLSFSCSNSDSCGVVAHGVALLPEVVVPIADTLLADGFE